ncbi:MAG TPA: F0F1 ATP synthase subunit delta [Micropepsaceae bacterium]|nr:F0F1 ATP synthase subunit delta [Micropepsaceae bacterium]
MATGESHSAGLAMRYATAAFDLAAEERALDRLATDFAAIKQMLSKSADLRQLVRSPVISREQQSAAIDAVLMKAGAADLMRKLVLLLAKKRRLFILSDIIASFEQLLARHRGEIAADVTSARELSADETAELKRILKDRFGREPRLTNHVDRSLLGGLVLKVGSRMIDSSLRTKLETLRAQMKG